MRNSCTILTVFINKCFYPIIDFIIRFARNILHSLAKFIASGGIGHENYKIINTDTADRPVIFSA
jgi:hypothetical protein